MHPTTKSLEAKAPERERRAPSARAARAPERVVVRMTRDPGGPPAPGAAARRVHRSCEPRGLESAAGPRDAWR